MVWREGKAHSITFADGEVIEPLKSRPLVRDEKKHGTRVTVWPNPKYFDSANIPQQELQHLLRSKAILLPGVKVTLSNLKKNESQTWQYSQGLRGYLTESLAQTSNNDILIPLFRRRALCSRRKRRFL